MEIGFLDFMQTHFLISSEIHLLRILRYRCRSLKKPPAQFRDCQVGKGWDSGHYYSVTKTCDEAPSLIQATCRLTAATSTDRTRCLQVWWFLGTALRLRKDRPVRGEGIPDNYRLGYLEIMPAHGAGMLPVENPHPNLWERDGSYLLAAPCFQPIPHPLLSSSTICICPNRAINLARLHKEPSPVELFQMYSQVLSAVFIQLLFAIDARQLLPDLIDFVYFSQTRFTFEHFNIITVDFSLFTIITSQHRFILFRRWPSGHGGNGPGKRRWLPILDR